MKTLTISLPLPSSLNVKTTLSSYLKGNKKLLSKYVNAGIVAANSATYVLGELVKHLITVQDIDLDAKLEQLEAKELHKSLEASLKDNKVMSKKEWREYTSGDNRYNAIDLNTVPAVSKWLESKKPPQDGRAWSFTRAEGGARTEPISIRKYDMTTRKWLDDECEPKHSRDGNDFMTPWQTIKAIKNNTPLVLDAPRPLSKMNLPVSHIQAIPNANAMRDALDILKRYADALEKDFNIDVSSVRSVYNDNLEELTDKETR